MKKLLLTVTLILSLATMSAQESKRYKIETLGRPPFKKHEWSVEASIGSQPSINAVWQYNFTGWFRLGTGTGMSFLASDQNLTANIFGRVGFMASRYNVRPYFTTDVGFLCTVNGANPDYMLFMYPRYRTCFCDEKSG